MATTISFPTAVTSNTANFNRTFADDGLLTTHPASGWGSHADIVLSSFSSLSIPSGATINGIEILAEAASNTGPNEPDMRVYNGSSWFKSGYLQILILHLKVCSRALHHFLMQKSKMHGN